MNDGLEVFFAVGGSILLVAAVLYALKRFEPKPDPAWEETIALKNELADVPCPKCASTNIIQDGFAFNDKGNGKVGFVEAHCIRGHKFRSYTDGKVEGVGWRDIGDLS